MQLLIIFKIIKMKAQNKITNRGENMYANPSRGPQTTI